MKKIAFVFKKMYVLPLLVTAALLLNCTEDHGVETTRFKLDDTSVAEWKGYLKTDYFNNGSIAVKSDDVVIQEGKVKSGSFTIPVASIVNFNLPADSLKHQLVHHLQSPDFFNMALHPNVSFEITSVEPFSGTGDGVVTGANFRVNGTLTLLGISKPLSFPAKIDITGDAFKLDGLASFDRTQFGMNYATEPGLPDEAAIKPVIDVHLKVTGKRI